MEQLNRVDVDGFKAQQKSPLVLVLDSVRSMNNVGSAFRTSDGFAIEKLYLCGITATPPHREIEKTALGATDSVDWEYIKETNLLIEGLKKEGYKVYAVEQADSSILLNDFEVELKGKYALVFGNEVYGVSDEVMGLVDGCIEIPQFGTKHSLNVSVAIGIVLWDLINKLKRKA